MTRNNPPEDFQPTSHRSTVGRVLIVAVPALVIILAMTAFFTMSLPKRITDRKYNRVKHLAVLPFENIGDKESVYFFEGITDGITDEITTKLASIPKLAVISRTSAKKYKGTDKDLQTIGRELGVDYVLKGTIRWDKRGDVHKLRITPRLIKVSDGSHIWTDTYEREKDGILVLQADIAKHVIETLKAAIGGDRFDRQQTPSPREEGPS